MDCFPFHVDIIIAGEHTILTIHNTGDEVTLLISIGYSLLVDNGLRRSREVTPHIIDAILNLHHLVERHRGTSIAFYAAFTLAHLQVAAEQLREDVRRDKHSPNL
jgi:hypothetical protein